jgi:kynurenine formamidase
MPRVIDLSHPIGDGTITYPGLPGPAISDHLSRADSRSRYADGYEFQIGRIEMVANTGTYLDTPFHRFADGHDLAGLDLARVAAVPGLLIEADGVREVDEGFFADHDVAGRAVLVHTGWSRHWGTERYGDPSHSFIGQIAAKLLVERGAAAVGIDSVNIDDTRTGERPIHTMLLAAEIPIIEHLRGLDELSGRPFTFFALPPAIIGMGTFPVRAIAVLGER